MSTQENKSFVKARTISGFKDWSPQEMRLKRYIIDTVAQVYESFGFSPLDTPTIESAQVLFGPDGQPADNQDVFLVRNTRYDPKSSDALACRFDLTVSLAKYVAMNMKQLPKPFKRWQSGKVFRGEKKRAGRFCEFIQLDADALFAPGIEQDAEIILMIYEAMTALGFDKFQIKVNNRLIADGLPQIFNFDPELLFPIIQILDSLDKSTPEQVIEKLAKKLERSLVLAEAKILAKRLVSLIADDGLSNDLLLKRISCIMNSSSVADKGLGDIVKLLDLLQAIGVPTEKIVYRPALVRGLAYYTGPVFETILTDKPEFGAVFSGGRYDGLVGRFVDSHVPATGASLGVDRLVEAAKELNIFDEMPGEADVLIAYTSTELATPVLKLAQKFRQEGISCLVCTGEERALGAQIGRAANNNIMLVVIFGDKEWQNGNVRIKKITAKDEFLASKQDPAAKTARTEQDVPYKTLFEEPGMIFEI